LSERNTNGEKKMNAEASNVKGKFYSQSQMNWMLKKGFAWVQGNLCDHEWTQPIYTKRGEYFWEPPHCERIDGEIVFIEGRYERWGK